VTRINPIIGLNSIRLNNGENRIDVADRMKRIAVSGFIEADPIARLFNVALSVCHPSKTKNGMIKTIHPKALEQYFRNLTLVFTLNLLQSIMGDREILPTSLERQGYLLKGTTNKLIINQKLESGGYGLEFGRIELENG